MIEWKMIKGMIGTGVKVFSSEQAEKLGGLVIAQMKDMISKGISPIYQTGRFDAYKGNQESRAVKSLIKEHKKNGGSASQLSILRGKQVEALKKYPYSVQSRYPGKQISPVNLSLSGDMLRDLKFNVLATSSGSFTISVGYDTGTLSSKKEQGHREGVNGQPSRPTIPAQGETFAASIQAIIRGAVNDSVKEIMETLKA